MEDIVHEDHGRLGVCRREEARSSGTVDDGAESAGDVAIEGHGWVWRKYGVKPHQIGMLQGGRREGRAGVPRSSFHRRDVGRLHVRSRQRRRVFSPSTLRARHTIPFGSGPSPKPRKLPSSRRADHGSLIARRQAPRPSTCGVHRLLQPLQRRHRLHVVHARRSSGYFREGSGSMTAVPSRQSDRKYPSSVNAEAFRLILSGSVREQ